MDVTLVGSSEAGKKSLQNTKFKVLPRIHLLFVSMLGENLQNLPEVKV